MSYSGGYSLKAIPLVASYFGNDGYAIVAEEFYPDRGWVRQSYRKRVSRAWARKLRAAGVTVVALRAEGRLADFRIEELTR
jgi:hypothetical protein